MREFKNYLAAALMVSGLLPGNAQTYRQLHDSAFYWAGKKDFKRGIELLNRAASLFPGQVIVIDYNTACLASLGGDLNLAFSKLHDVIHSEKWNDFRYANDPDLNPLHSDERWAKLMQLHDSLTEVLNRTIAGRILEYRNIQMTLDKYWELKFSEIEHLTPKKIYKTLSAMKSPGIVTGERFVSFFSRISDSLEVSYLVQLPFHFDPDKKYPLIVALHGGVRFTEIPLVADSIAGFNYYDKPYFRNALRKDVLSVYLFANKKYNWTYTEDGFGMVPKIVVDMKKYFNIDDNRIYMVSHSNGATGAFSYLVKQPGLFAGFSGFNNKPHVFTGGTFFRNISNRYFYNVSTDMDYYFPLSGHITFDSLAKVYGLPWENVIYTSYPHWFPSLPESEEAFVKLYDKLLLHNRNPFQQKIYWECDDIKYGRCDWMEILDLDTMGTKASWHNVINFSVSHWRDPNDFNHVIDSTAQAFHFPRRSGAVMASYSDNCFMLETSRVRRVRVFISPHMVNLQKPVTVSVNGRILFRGRITCDKSTIIKQFQSNFDRSAIWTNVIELDVSPGY